ncbi:hypothetical protein N836_05235 [Leptolyngbya sp. Heron Island J]|uniref:hypothetical protein n=1 Tax=Leptolyngbya sp. Heron Island J TaxID=1385935 RepID=UPI0003B985DB|nr:hypothetical protein [Leptolyngbya sp. Heron Island J]ESA36967.1 hypothetical protein N836_05235 [Leptolyngbya sp. Heron Island J]
MLERQARQLLIQPSYIVSASLLKPPSLATLYTKPRAIVTPDNWCDRSKNTPTPCLQQLPDHFYMM